MNKIYLSPYIIIFMFIMLYILQPLSWVDVLVAFLVAVLITIIYVVLYIELLGKYYYYQVFKKGKHYPMQKIYKMVHKVGNIANRFMRLKVEVFHYERFDPDKNYLIIPNHQSNADATILLDVFKSPILFVAKSSLAKIPILKEWMPLIGCLFLDKEDMRGQIRIMQQVIKKLKNNESVIIFPEGKRSFSPEMNPFKPGTLKMALKAKVDILPITTNHVHKLRENSPWRKTKTTVYIHEPVPYEEFKDLSSQELAKKIQNIVETKVEI